MNVSKLVIAVFSSALAFSAFAVEKLDSTVDKNGLIAKHHHHKHKSEHKRDVAKHKIKSDKNNKH